MSLQVSAESEPNEEVSIQKPPEPEKTENLPSSITLSSSSTEEKPEKPKSKDTTAAERVRRYRERKREEKKTTLKRVVLKSPKVSSKKKEEPEEKTEEKEQKPLASSASKSLFSNKYFIIGIVVGLGIISALIYFHLKSSGSASSASTLGFPPQGGSPFAQGWI
jgi:DNA replicative helicase MCM subunit Mcm2 (Cdc46/Mcm family)